VSSGLSKLGKNDAAKKLKALEMLEKLLGNIVRDPKEVKFQKIRLTNEKIAAVVIETDGSKDILEGAGFSHDGGEFMVFSDESDKSHHGLRGALNSIRNSLYEIKGRPNSEAELGGQAQFGAWNSDGKIGSDDALAKTVSAAGGICAEKFDAKMNDDGDRFTIEQARRLEDALEYLQENNPHAAYAATVELVYSLLERIAADPENAALRCIPSDAQFDAKTAAAEGALALLEAVGFTLMAVDGEGNYVCDLGPAAVRGITDRIEVARRDGKLQGKLEQVKATTKVAATVERATRVLRMVGSQSASNMVIPEHYFTLTKGDMVAAVGSGSTTDQLKTENMRQKEALARRKKYQRTCIRVQFPDELIIQMEFSPRETVGTLLNEVRNAINDQGRAFVLRLGSEMLNHPTRSLWDAGLVPSALIHFRWKEPSGSDDIGSIMRHELLCSVEFIE